MVRTLKCDHIKRLIAFPSDYVKRLLLYHQEDNGLNLGKRIEIIIFWSLLTSFEVSNIFLGCKVNHVQNGDH